jgi:predicted hydrocarbon binding protein
MRQVKIDQEELRQIKKLYEGVMSHACHGLFFKEGSVIGAPMAELALKDRPHYFELAGQQLREHGWVEDVTFAEREVTVRGSIEVSPSDIPTCHRLRGMMREFYERFKGGRVKCTEEMCASTGHPECRFRIEEL